jgi:CRP/FNR family cyclic AMP-dependent transcriptional regulator
MGAKAVMAPKTVRRFDAKSFLAEVGMGRTVAQYRKSDVIFSQGDVGDAVFYILRGRVKLTVISARGKEAVVAVLGAGEFLGEGCLLAQATRVESATAMTECSIFRIQRQAMVRALHDHHELSEFFVAHLLWRNIRYQEDLVDQLFNSSEKRLARILLLLANFGKGNRPEKINPKISQETLAQMVGTTRSRVSLFMNKFRRLGFIAYNGEHDGELEVNSSLLDMVLHDGTAVPK